MDREVGTLEWVRRTDGNLTAVERLSLATGMLRAVGEGVTLAWRARNDERRRIPLDALAPPETPMVVAARAYLLAHCDRAMVNHSLRAGFWTLAVLHQRVPHGAAGAVGDRERETAWVAALLHDVGLEVPPARGDFSLGGVAVLEALASETREDPSSQWSDEQTYLASQAIAANLSSRVDRATAGDIAWAMNVGGLAELGFPIHRAQLAPERRAEIDALHSRVGFRETATRLIREEVRRAPRGRFALFQYVFPLLMRD